MAPLLFMCPKTNQEAPTGIETDADVLRHLPKIETAVHCPECGEKHFWTRDDAVLLEAPPTKHAA